MEKMFESAEFEEYQELLADKLTVHISSLLATERYPEMKGAQLLINTIINIPCKKYPENDNIKLGAIKAMANFKSNFVRKALND